MTLFIAGGTTPIKIIRTGENTLEAARQALLAAGSADDAALSAASAEAASGPTYASTAAGLAATSNGQGFAVDNGDGTVSVYLNAAGVAVLQRTLATTGYLAADAGADAIGFLQAAGAVVRTVQDKLRDTVSLKDFGAVGDNATNDTDAVAAAVAYMESTGYPVYVPPGIYLTDPFALDVQTYTLQGSFFGDEDASTVIKRRTAGAGAFITLGALAGTAFQANLFMSGITIDGGATTNGPACIMYDVVRSQFEGVTFKGGSYALQSYGGIANTFDHCKFQDATRGVQIEKFTSAAGGGWPNILRFNNCHFIDCAEWGVWFDYGRMLVLDGCQIEGNGTTLAASEGGIYVGANVGTEVTVSDPESVGLVCYGCWFEANKGVADIHLNSGLNTVQNCNFFSTSTQTTNDIKIEGGRYRLRDLNSSFAKTANLLEGAGVSVGNAIDFVQFATLIYNSAKTRVDDGWRMLLGNGAVPGVNGATAPLIQTGSDSSSANPTITFNQAFKAGTTPRVYCQIINNSESVIEQPEVYSISNTGFTVRKKSFNGSVISTSNYTIYWVAIGENP